MRFNGIDGQCTVARMDAPPGYRVRPATLDDVPAIAGIMASRSREVIGVPDTDEEEVRGLLTAPGRSLAEETRVLVDADGTVVAFVDVAFNTDEQGYRHALPEVAPGLVGGPVHRWAVATAGSLGAAREAATGGSRPVEIGAWADDPPTAAVLEAAGYRAVRWFDLMTRELDPRPDPPSFPDGVELRPVGGEDDLRDAHAVLVEAFGDHDGGGFPSFERFLHGLVHDRYAPELSAVARSDGEAVGAVIAFGHFPERPATGYVADLGVRRAARTRGLGLALLLWSLGGMADAGLAAAALHVDADSLTGATRLYARAGMERHPRYARWART